MKRILSLLICLGLLLALCACGAQTSPEGPAAPEMTTAAPETTDPPQTTAEPETTASAQTEAENSEQDMVELVRSYIDKPVEELYALIGEPQSSDYAASCLGDGEDGLLIYDGFVVYTYREGDSETVYDVE